MSSRETKEILIGLFLFILFLLNIVDGALTIVWVQMGIATEANPIMNFLLQEGPEYMMLFKIVLVGSCITLLWFLRLNRITQIMTTVGMLTYLMIMIVHLTVFVRFINEG